MSSSIVKKEKYEPGKINYLYHMISSAFNSDVKQDYEILVDNYKVIPRNNDPERFNGYTEYINGQTKDMTVILFKGTSNSNDKFIYFFDEKDIKPSGLDGIPEGMTLAQWGDKQKEQWEREKHYQDLESENASLKSELLEKTREVAELTVSVQDAKEGRLTTVTDVGTSMLLKIVTLPGVQKKFPFLQEISDTLGHVDPNQETAKNETASFSRKASADEDAVEETSAKKLSHKELGYLKLIKDLEEILTDQELNAVMQILDILTKFPNSIGPTLKHLMNFLNSRKNKAQKP